MLTASQMQVAVPVTSFEWSVLEPAGPHGTGSILDINATVLSAVLGQKVQDELGQWNCEGVSDR